jgi:hypothetical protein
VRRGSLLLWIFGLVAIAALSIVAEDVLKLGRRAPPLAPGNERATVIVVEKQARRLTLLRDQDDSAGQHQAAIS